jgi:hypothetical protein
MSESFSAFREQYLSRHENPVNSALQTVAAVVAVGGLAAAVVTRRIRVALIGDTVAFAIATVGIFYSNRGPCETTSSRTSAIRSGTSEPRASASLLASPNRPRRWCHQATPWQPRGSGEVNQYRAEME